VSEELPPFPVDDATLDMLMAAIDPWNHGNPDAKSSSVWPFLAMMSRLGGSDPEAVAEVHDDSSDGGASIVTMRDPHYHDNDVAAALISEVRKLRGQRDQVLAEAARTDATVPIWLRDEIRNIYAGEAQQ